MFSIKLSSKGEKIIRIILVVTTYVMIICRFLLNEKGRINPDSIRYMRQAKIFPVIDNTTAPLGYPLLIKFFTFFGADEFWSSKLIGILSYSFILIFCWRKQFYFRELLVASSLFSFVSIYSFTMSEAAALPFLIGLFFVSNKIIENKIQKTSGVLLLSILLIALLNIRYSALFLCMGSIVFGIWKIRKSFGSSFVIAGIVGFCSYGLYKVLFIDYFNQNYVDTFLEIGLKPTWQLLAELFQGLSTTFNPFIHIADPGGGVVNYGIYGIGTVTLVAIIFVFIRTGLSEAEQFVLTTSVAGVVCSYFVQYFYSVNALDYRLLAPFVIGVWMVFFRKLFQVFGGLTYAPAFLSLAVGFVFTWLSRGSYLENRRMISEFLEREHLKTGTIKFYLVDEITSDDIQTAELISTVNPRIYTTFRPADTLDARVLTRYRVERRVHIKKNNYQ